MAGQKGEREAALARAVEALARHDHSAQSISAKLERAGLSEEVRADAVATLVRAGYLDDVRFARDRAALLAGRGYGDERIRVDLETQGVVGEPIEAALAALEPERERAYRVAGAAGSDARMLRMLERRGFSEEAVEAVAVGRLRGHGAQE